MSGRTIRITLSDQDLSDFLDDNQAHMSAYAAELRRRLVEFYTGCEVEVTIRRNALVDKFEFYSDDVEWEMQADRHAEDVQEIMNRMVNDWSWLQNEDKTTNHQGT